MRKLLPALFLLLPVAVSGPRSPAQPNPRLQAFFVQNVGLTQDQIDGISHGIPVVKSLPARSPTEVFLFGAVYVQATPESYLRLVLDFDRMRRLPGYLALGVFQQPPRLADLNGFLFDSDDLRDMQKCRPGDCLIQLPASTIEELHRSIDWSAPDAAELASLYIQGKALHFLEAYQRDGNHALGVYNDKRNPTFVDRQFAYMLSYYKAIPAQLPDFYNYLLSYPEVKPANVEDRFYWTKIKFGLKSTLRIIHLVVMKGKPTEDLAYAIAEKQLYSSHYFDTALSLYFCVRGRDDSDRQGFYLITVMGSEQAALAGLKGEIIRRVAIDRSTSSLQAVLASIRNSLEADSGPRERGPRD